MNYPSATAGSTVDSPTGERRRRLFLTVWGVLTLPVGALLFLAWLLDHRDQAGSAYGFLPIFLVVYTVTGALVALIPAVVVWFAIRLVRAVRSGRSA